MTRVFFSAGDTSGDQHAAVLLAGLRERVPGLKAEGLGGPCLEQAGCTLHEDLVNANIFGLADSLKAVPHYFGVLRRVAGILDARRPDRVIIVDYPGLNLFIARLAHRRGIPVTYFIAPQLWSWAPWRARRFARCVDEALVIFPFEQAFFSNAGIPSTYIGHPVLDALPADESALLNPAITERPRPVALLPGSRPREVERHMPILLAAAQVWRRRHPDVSFHTAHVSADARVRMAALAAAADIELIDHGHSARAVHSVMASCRCAAVSSGTATLETAMLGTPHAVLYQLSKFERRVADLLALTPWAGQANLLAGRELCPEVIQVGSDPTALIDALEPFLADDAAVAAKREELAALRRTTGGPGALRRAADHIAASLAT